ncbi:MAG: endonuclease domain-containing protein [Pseudomonadota bacterium]
MTMASGKAAARAEVFRFQERRFDPVTGTLELAYGFERGEPLVETFVFPYAPWPEDPARRVAFGEACALLHLLAGVSYYKAALPPVIDTGSIVLDTSLAHFLQTSWTEGLGEFAYVNELDLRDTIRFPVGEDVPPNPPVDGALGLPDRALVAMGGGKDSLVSLELLRAADIEVQPVTVGNSELIGDTVRAAGLPLLRIERTLAPRLLDMNRAGAWNGHVPVTAINMAILACAALLYGYRWVVFSNERSAEEATRLNADGQPVNHQYSKSLAFERAFGTQLAQRVAPDLEVFSLLRPLGEAAVTRRFADMTRYHPVFSSCNRNFHRDGSRIEGRWCGDCPKCRFTSLALAPWLSPEALTAILGANLLDDPQQETGFRALASLGVEKPFECVGTVEESRALLAALACSPAWKDFAVVKALAPEVSGTEPILASLLSVDGPHCIPDEILARVAF